MSRMPHYATRAEAEADTRPHTTEDWLTLMLMGIWASAVVSAIAVGLIWRA